MLGTRFAITVRPDTLLVELISLIEDIIGELLILLEIVFNDAMLSSDDVSTC